MLSGFSSFYQPYISILNQQNQALREQLLRSGVVLNPPSLETILFDPLVNRGVEVQCLRLDQVHPVISGNKWYKLKFNLSQALLEGKDRLISFGGPWSNHLHAFSYAGTKAGFRTTAIIRGEEWRHKSNPLLDDLRDNGTELIFVSRDQYRQRNDPMYQRQFLIRFANSYLIPEGGDNFFGVLGVSSLLSELQESQQQTLLQCNGLALACGTGNTFAGFRVALPQRVSMLGFSALKGDWYTAMLKNKMAGFWPLVTGNWQLFSQFHGGGFGKLNESLQSFMVDFESDTGMLLDPVYTAKLLCGFLIF